MDGNNIKESDLTQINGRNFNNWKWNYLYDNIRKQNATIAAKTQNNTGVNPQSQHAFYTDFDEFSISLMKKENSDYSEFEIKETDLLELDDETNTSGKNKETILTSDDDCVKETDFLTATDDEFTDVSSLTGTLRDGLSLNGLDRSYISIPGDEDIDEPRSYFRNSNGIDGASNSFRRDDIYEPPNTFRSSSIFEKPDPVESNEKVEGRKTNNSHDCCSIEEKLVKFQDLESDYFETDCETMDSGIFPHKDTEYFQDIGSDFFEEDEECNVVTSSKNNVDKARNITYKDTHIPHISNSNKTKPTKRNDKLNDSSTPELSPVSPLPPGKTATMSNSLLRSTICELERALSDSNKLLIKRDQKMTTIRSHNIELKKTLSKELESNNKMKHLLAEKDKAILDKQTKIIALNQEIHEINDKLSNLRLNRLNEIHSSRSSNNTNSPNEDSASKPCTCSTQQQPQIDTPITPEEDNVDKLPNTNSQSTCKSNKRRSSCKQKSQDTDSDPVPSKGVANSQQNTDKQDTVNKLDTDDGKEKPSSGELQANLRIKFMRDAFFYYMIGFHPDEQINAILAILEYGDRRQDFVLEAHNMRKVGKKFNVSKVSSRAHSFVQEEFQ